MFKMFTDVEKNCMVLAYAVVVAVKCYNSVGLLFLYGKTGREIVAIQESPKLCQGKRLGLKAH